MLPIVVVVALRGRDEQDVDTALAVLRACSNCYHGLRFSPNCDSVVRDWGWRVELRTRAASDYHIRLT